MEAYVKRSVPHCLHATAVPLSSNAPSQPHFPLMIPTRSLSHKEARPQSQKLSKQRGYRHAASALLIQIVLAFADCDCPCLISGRHQEAFDHYDSSTLS